MSSIYSPAVEGTVLRMHEARHSGVPDGPAVPRRSAWEIPPLSQFRAIITNGVARETYADPVTVLDESTKSPCCS